MSASGLSYKAIAHQSNAEGIQSPQPQKGRIDRSWCVSPVRHVLRNRRYTGKVIWNTRRKVRVPGSVYFVRARSQSGSKSMRHNFVSCRMIYLLPSGSDEKIPQGCGEGCAGWQCRASLMLAHPDSMIQARAMLAEQFGKITLAPVNDNSRLTYAAKGTVDLFAGSRVERAEGPDSTISPCIVFSLQVAA
jgi:hypothetical protein